MVEDTKRKQAKFPQSIFFENSKLILSKKGKQ